MLKLEVLKIIALFYLISQEFYLIINNILDILNKILIIGQYRVTLLKEICGLERKKY